MNGIPAGVRYVLDINPGTASIATPVGSSVPSATPTSARTGANLATIHLDPSGTNAVQASSFSARFLRLKAAER